MSVEAILAQLAQQAGQRRESILGGAIAGVSQLPGQILDDRERRRIQMVNEARQAEQLAFQRHADERATSDQAMQDVANQTAVRKQAIAREVIKAYTGGTPNDPSTNNLEAGIARARELGAEDLIPGLKETHRKELLDAQPKITQEDPTKDTYANGVLTKPAAPKAMTPAEQAQRDETARHNKATEAISALTEGRTEAAQRETARHNRATEKTGDPFGGQGGAGIDLEKLPPTVRDQAQALVDGRRQLDPRLAGKPLGQTIINAAYGQIFMWDGRASSLEERRSDPSAPTSK